MMFQNNFFFERSHLHDSKQYVEFVIFKRFERPYCFGIFLHFKFSVIFSSNCSVAAIKCGHNSKAFHKRRLILLSQRIEVPIQSLYDVFGLRS